MDLKVNDAEWNALGKDEQAKIEAVIKGFFKGAKIVPDPATAKTAHAHGAALANPQCITACNIAGGGRQGGVLCSR